MNKTLQKDNRFKSLMQVIKHESLETLPTQDQPLDGSDNSSFLGNQPEVIWIPHSNVHRDPKQARRYFDKLELEKMAVSMKSVGVIDPLSVRLRHGTSDQYDLLAGEKRHRAAEIASLSLVPARVFNVTERIAEDIKAISNLQRSDLNKWEETNAIMGMLCRNLNKSQSEVISLLNQAANQKRGLTDNVVRKSDWDIIEEVFDLVGRLTPESYRKHRVPLLKLPTSIQDVLQNGELDYTKINEILKVRNPEQQQLLLTEAIERNLSVSELQNRIKGLRNATVKPGTELLSDKFDVVYRQCKRSKVLDDPKKKKQVEKLLSQLKALIGD